MSRTAARITQADVARALRAAQSAGPTWRVELRPRRNDPPHSRLPGVIHRNRATFARRSRCSREGLAPLIPDMPRPRWPHLLREVSRHGTIRWVVRVGHGPRTPLEAPYGSPEFEAQYHAAVRGEAAQRPPKRAEGSLSWLVALYRGSSAWASLAPATQKQRANILKHVLASAGEMPLSKVRRSHIIQGREDRARTPSQANNFLNTMRSLFKWAIEHRLVDEDPTDGVKIVKRPKTGGFEEALEEDIARF